MYPDEKLAGYAIIYCHDEPVLVSWVQMHTIPAIPTDINQLIHWISDRTACLMWAGPQVGFPFETVSLRKEIDYDPNNSFCLRHNGSIKAFGQLLSKQAGRLHMARIIVDPDSRGQGYGRYLCTDLIQIARERNVHTLTLNVYRDNLLAIKLYRDLGFEDVHENSTAEYIHMHKLIS